MKRANRLATPGPLPLAGKIRNCTRGQTLVEYALIIAVISIVAIGVMVNLGQTVKSAYSNMTSTMAAGMASTH